MNKRILTTIVSTVLAVGAWSQTLTNMQPTSEPLRLPALVRGISVVDDDIYCFTKDFTLRVSESHGMLSKAEPEKLVTRKGVNYAVRNPETDELYYTHKFGLFKSKLYAIPYGKDGKGKALKFEGGKMSVEHPTISENGEYMVFSSKNRKGQGGKDLYITVNTGQGWSSPEPIAEVNSPGNETCPNLWQDYLIFASDGHNNSRGGSDLYAIKIKVKLTHDDSVGYKVEKSYGKLQHLPPPFNSEYNERAAMVYNGRTYVVREGDSTSMGDMLTSYNGTPDLVAIYGIVVDGQNHPQPRTQITINSNDSRSIETLTNVEGRYSLFLKKDNFYEIIFGKVSYGVSRQMIETKRQSEDALIEERSIDVEITSYDPGQYIELQGLFGDDAAVELTKEGREKLSGIVAFLSGNPAVQVQMTMYCGLENNKDFNRIIAERRSKNLLEYIHAKVPAAKNITVTNGGAFDTSKNNARVNDLLAIKLGVF